MTGLELPFVVFFMMHIKLDAGIPDRAPAVGIKFCQKLEHEYPKTLGQEQRNVATRPILGTYICTEKSPGYDPKIPDASGF